MTLRCAFKTATNVLIGILSIILIAWMAMEGIFYATWYLPTVIRWIAACSTGLITLFALIFYAADKFDFKEYM